MFSPYFFWVLLCSYHNSTCGAHSSPGNSITSVCQHAAIMNSHRDTNGKKSLIQLKLLGKCRSVEYHYSDRNLSGTQGLTQLFLGRILWHYSMWNPELSWQSSLPLNCLPFTSVQYWVALFGPFAFSFPHYCFIQVSGCLCCRCCPDLSLLNCMLSNRITALPRMTYIWLAPQHLILSSKS